MSFSQFVVSTDMSQVQQSAAPPPAARLMNIATSYWDARAVHVATELGLSDYLAHGPLSAEELAVKAGVNALSLYRMLRGLAAIGVYEHTAEDKFALTPMSDVLRRDAPNSVRDGVLLFGHEMFWRSWGDLRGGVESGEVPFQRIFGQPFFDWLTATPAAAQTFDGGMTALSRPILATLLESYDFSTARKIIDIGGGHGSLLSAILQRYPAASGVVFDLPHVAAEATKQFAAAGLHARAQAVGGSMFESAPKGGDLYVMKWIMHDWDDESCVSILRHCRAAMQPSGKILIIDRVLPERVTESPQMRNVIMADLLMMIHLTGRERTERQFRGLFAQAGVQLARVIPTQSAVSLVEVVAASS